jgi:hypothetical protein
MLEDRLAESLDGLALDAPVSEGSLTVFPLVGPDKPGPRYLTLDEALAKGLAEITEVSDHGRVPELFFENKGEDPVLLVDGEELVGAKQNRVLNLSILVRGKSRITIPVSCVEAGRWAASPTPTFASSDRSMFAHARASKAAQVSESLRATGERASDQSKVWNDIDRKLQAVRAAAPTRAMSAAYEKSRPDVERHVSALGKPDPKQRGAIYLINGAIAGVELFDKAATFAKLAPKLARSYALDAVDAPARAQSDEALIASLSFERLKKFKIEAYPGTDLGTDLRLSSETMNGAALFAGEAVVHLEAFAPA